jgi:hypothetical protein
MFTEFLSYFNYLFVKNKVAFSSRIFFRVTKNGRFLTSAGGGVGAQVRKRPFLARLKKISGKKWFVTNMKFCFLKRLIYTKKQ